MKIDNDSYYKGNDEILPNIIEVKSNYMNMNFELPWDAGIEDYIHVFYTILIGQTFIEKSIITEMAKFAINKMNKEELKELKKCINEL